MVLVYKADAQQHGRIHIKSSPSRSIFMHCSMKKYKKEKKKREWGMLEKEEIDFDKGNSYSNRIIRSPFVLRCVCVCVCVCV